MPCRQTLSILPPPPLLRMRMKKIGKGFGNETSPNVMEVVYKRAALVLKRLQRKEGSLKSLVFSTKSNDVISFRKQIYAIVAETLKR